MYWYKGGLNKMLIAIGIVYDVNMKEELDWEY